MAAVTEADRPVQWVLPALARTPVATPKQREAISVPYDLETPVRPRECRPA